MAKKQKPTAGPEPEEFDGGLNFSKKLIFRIFYISIIVAALGIGSFLFYQEFKKPKISGNGFNFSRSEGPETKDYSNDYWGFKFQYPGSWWPVIGSFEDGDYFFSSQNISFVQDLEEQEALLEVTTFHNLKNLSFEDWLKDREENYFLRGKTLKKTALTIAGYPAMEYQMLLNRPEPNRAFYDIVVISEDTLKKYIFTLETANQTVHDRFYPVFQAMLAKVKFYPGFGS